MRCLSIAYITTISSFKLTDLQWFGIYTVFKKNPSLLPRLLLFSTCCAVVFSHNFKKVNNFEFASSSVKCASVKMLLQQ